MTNERGGRLEGKICVITGAAGGIGAEAVTAFAREGATVVAADLQPVERDDAEARRVDVTDPSGVAELYASVAERHGGIDVLFNNAGISPPEDASVLDAEVELWQRIQDVNLLSVMLCCREGIPHLLARGGGAVINTASFVAVMGSRASQIAYTASKGGVLAMTRELGVEFAAQGVRVNALCPGPVATPLLEELFAADPERAEKRLRRVPAGRFARPAEIAAAALFLASDESSFVNGATFLVDGGISASYLTDVG